MNQEESNDTPPPPQKELRIAIGSKNPAKINAVIQALQRILEQKGHWEVMISAASYDVASGVPDQPMGDQETCLGAKNRAQAAYFAYRKAHDNTPPHLSFGLEGGLEEFTMPFKGTSSGVESEKHLYCMAWTAIYGQRSPFLVDLVASKDVKTYHGDRTPRFGYGKTGTFPIPPQVTDLVETGVELGSANDKVFETKESRSGLGAVGVLTDGLIDRSQYYEHAIILALAPWFRPDVFP